MKLLIIGATSAIAQAYARIRAQAHDEIFLVARNSERLQILSADLQTRGACIAGTMSLDVTAFEEHEAMLATVLEKLGGLDTVLIAHGTLADQKIAERNFTVAEQEIKTNFLSVVSLLTPIATHLEQQRHGTIAVISSVAGDRGRRSNFIYGSAKAGLSAYLAGLRSRLHGCGVTVLTIKPGFVDTPMTAHLRKGLLFASPERIAGGIDRAIRGRKDVVYLPGFWFWIMLVIRWVPEFIFKRLKI